MGKRKKHPDHKGVSRPRGPGDRPMVPEDIIPAPLAYLIAPANHRNQNSHFWLIWGERAELFKAEMRAATRRHEIRRKWRTRKQKRSLPAAPESAAISEGE